MEQNAKRIEPGEIGSMTLVEIAKAMSTSGPPYPDELLDALGRDERAGARRLKDKLLAAMRAEQRSRRRIDEMLKHERKARADGFKIIAGVDEVGRGPLAGPVVAAAVILPQDAFPAGVNDSKTLTDARRRKLFPIIAAAADVGIGVVGPGEIDRVNIYRANVQAIKLAISDLAQSPDMVLLDGKPVRDLGVPHRAIVKGDRLSISIAAASIIAKVIRDQMMLEFDKKYPEYMFAKHKGYGTAEHMESLKDNGASPIHRRSFAPVSENLRGGSQ
jgi:ribonuclease HII